MVLGCLIFAFIELVLVVLAFLVRLLWVYGCCLWVSVFYLMLDLVKIIVIVYIDTDRKSVV